jgi:alanine racemase
MMRRFTVSSVTFSLAWPPETRVMVQSPNNVKIDLSALVYNLNQVKTLINPGIKVVGVVKSDAYGHGLLRVSRVLEEKGVDYLGVAHLQEALKLRTGGIRIPILILCGIQTYEEAMEVAEKDLTPVIFDLEAAEILVRVSERRGKKIHVQVKIDTGMGRLGIPHWDVASFLKKIRDWGRLYIDGLTSHLSSADEPESEFTLAQIGDFEKAIEIGRAMGLQLPLNNLANSAGIMAYKASHFDMVRPGIMLYGGLPSPGFQAPLPLKPVMHFRGRVLQIRDLPDHSPVSYGRSYYTKGSQTLAVFSAGYGDGLPRSLSNRGKVLINGKKVNIIGRVCMNMTVADITGLEGILPSTEVVFLGRQGDAMITGDDVAGWGDTISYEIFCSVGQRHTREYSQ